MPTISRSTRRRRARTGAVLVEGLLVCVLLSVLLACIVFAHNLYSQKIASVNRARDEAWTKSLPGCGGGLSMLLLDALSGGMLDALTLADAADVIDTPNWMSNLGRGVGTPPATSVTLAGASGGRSFSLRSRVSLACNEFGDDKAGSLLVDGAKIVRDLIPGI